MQNTQFQSDWKKKTQNNRRAKQFSKVNDVPFLTEYFTPGAEIKKI